MALDTKPCSFVAHVPARHATRCKKGDVGGGGTKLGSSTSRPPEGPGSRIHGDTEDHMVTLSAETKQMSADVLVVDDDADVRWTVAEVLRSAGFSVAEAEDGEIARVMLSTGSYRMVLLDMRMPRRDGVSLIEAVGTVPPVIVHSAYSLDASDLERLGSRVVDYLHKPVSPQKLLRAVEAVLEAGD